GTGALRKVRQGRYAQARVEGLPLPGSGVRHRRAGRQGRPGAGPILEVPRPDLRQPVLRQQRRLQRGAPHRARRGGRPRPAEVRERPKGGPLRRRGTGRFPGGAGPRHKRHAYLLYQRQGARRFAAARDLRGGHRGGREGGRGWL
ncbi:MAG: hypothetical protein AVDCRST_MAG12-2702, partial [uncultured Rubrobacteraceae bacterium]